MKNNMIKIESMEKEFEDMLEKKRKEIQLDVDKQVIKYKRRYFIVELIVSIIGYGLITYSVSFWLALGVWFAIWGNNMGMTRNIYKTKNISREIWKD